MAKAVEQTTYAVGRHFSGFVFRRHPAAKPEKFVAYRKGRPERPMRTGKMGVALMLDKSS